jgi:hypothetical protein
MRSRYSIILGMVIVVSLLFVVNLISYYNAVAANFLLVVLLAGGYVTTYTSNIGKSRVALISGVGVSIILTTYQLLINTNVIFSTIDLISFLVIPGFVMLIGGFIAKITKNEMDELLHALIKRISDNNNEKNLD